MSDAGEPQLQSRAAGSRGADRAAMPSALAGGLLLLVCARLSGALELSARGVAHSVLVRCATDGAFADRALSSTLSKAALEPRDARLATEITYGVLRNTRSLDFALEQLVAQLDRTSAAERAALRMGTFELLHMRTLADVVDGFIVSESLHSFQTRHQKPLVLTSVGTTEIY